MAASEPSLPPAAQLRLACDWRTARVASRTALRRLHSPPPPPPPAAVAAQASALPLPAPGAPARPAAPSMKPGVPNSPSEDLSDTQDLLGLAYDGASAGRGTAGAGCAPAAAAAVPVASCRAGWLAGRARGQRRPSCTPRSTTQLEPANPSAPRCRSPLVPQPAALFLVLPLKPQTTLATSSRPPTTRS